MKTTWAASVLYSLLVTVHAVVVDTEAGPLVEARATNQVISANSPLIWYHGRWDDLPSSWWPGSGFKLAFSKAPTSLILNIGSSVPVPVSARFGEDGEWVTLNMTAGANTVPLTSIGLLNPSKAKYPLVLDVVTQMENADGRLQLKSIELDSGAKLIKYKPSKYAFEFIGDSITAGYLSPRGVVDDYSFKTGDYFNAEHNQIAQSGACLTDALCWGNPRGIDYLYFQTQNSAYVYLNNNVSTAWDFKEYAVLPTHLFINIGTNDRYWGFNGTAFTNTYITFLQDLRKVYKTQPIFILSMWGYPAPQGVSPYFDAEIAGVIAGVKDKNVHLVNTTGWIEYGDAFDDYTHPTPNGHTKLSYRLIDWLLNFGLKVQ